MTPRNHRGFTSDGKEVRGSHCQIEGVDYIVTDEAQIIPSDEPVVGFIEVLPESVGQSTGLKDKKKAEVFGGHKIKYLEKIWAIRWNEDEAGFVYESLTWEKNQHAWDFTCDIACECVIVGNIHKTP